MRLQLLFLSFFIISTHRNVVSSSGVGVCYGRVANNLMPPADIVGLLLSNGISKVRIFDADQTTLKAFANTGVELMIGVPNELLPELASGDQNTAMGWLQNSVFAFIQADQIKYIAVGNEIFLKDQFYTPFIVPAIRNLHQALRSVNLDGRIKLSSPHAASVLSNPFPPSAGAFNPDVLQTMYPLLQFLAETGAPLMVNVYPFFSYVNNPKDISLTYAVFNSPPVVQDNGLLYDNLFDATIDAFVSAMERVGFEGIQVVVTETGWPTGGGVDANPGNALAYNGNIIRRAVNNVGTPKRPGIGVEAFLFDLFDENEKGGEEFEKHFGIFTNNGLKAYDLNFR